MYLAPRGYPAGSQVASAAEPVRSMLIIADSLESILPSGDAPLPTLRDYPIQSIRDDFAALRVCPIDMVYDPQLVELKDIVLHRIGIVSHRSA
jgi:hypothetical protein